MEGTSLRQPAQRASALGFRGRQSSIHPGPRRGSDRCRARHAGRRPRAAPVLRAPRAGARLRAGGASDEPSRDRGGTSDGPNSASGLRPLRSSPDGPAPPPRLRLGQSSRPGLRPRSERCYIYGACRPERVVTLRRRVRTARARATRCVGHSRAGSGRGGALPRIGSMSTRGSGSGRHSVRPRARSRRGARSTEDLRRRRSHAGGGSRLREAIGGSDRRALRPLAGAARADRAALARDQRTLLDLYGTPLSRTSATRRETLRAAAGACFA